MIIKLDKMKRLKKSSSESIDYLIELITDSIYDRSNFFYNISGERRFFSPKYKIFDSTNTRAQSYDSELSCRITRAILDVLTLDYTIASYINSDGHYVVQVGKTHDSCIESAKNAKLDNEINTLDLKTGKVFNTNG